ncbi:Fis family transcriptional regulator [Nocardioides daphniae]|uniref:Fis family transcriptional regulator n=3 Tax=Nocardioides daphniae TaxID=402297 RepID=A0ABQ1Q0E4_9ACTN|nr:Fis family transcriptional regulator [Nocardioides daphniae]
MARYPEEPRLSLPPDLVEELTAELPSVADAAVAAIIAEVPTYANALSGPMGEVIRDAVALALGGFVQLGARGDRRSDRPAAASMDGAYQLGRGEARSGRSMEALLAAYRVGSRVSWRQMAVGLVGAGVDSATVAAYAELVFAYMDQLSDQSATGHRDETNESGRARQRMLDALARALVEGQTPEAVAPLASRAEWEPPETLTAVLVPEAQGSALLGLIAPSSLLVDDPASRSQRSVLLVPDAHRSVLLRAVAGHGAVVGPTRPWLEVRASYERARRALSVERESRSATLDTEAHLADLVVTADPDALRDLREQVLAPLAGMSGSTREKLVETLRAWLLHQGRRDAVAATLFVHPQTVRYRMGQLREAYGEELDDPEFVRRATIALG